jgi:hypothetical protein
MTARLSTTTASNVGGWEVSVVCFNNHYTVNWAKNTIFTGFVTEVRAVKACYKSLEDVSRCEWNPSDHVAKDHHRAFLTA